MWKIVKKVYLYEKNSQKEWKIHFPRKGTLFLFWNLKNNRKKCTLTRRNSQKFPRKGTHFLLFWNVKNSIKRVYLYEKNSQKEWKAYIFLGRVLFFYFFFPGTILVTIFSLFFHIFFLGTVLVTFFFTDFLLINCFMFSRGWLKFPCARITHQHFFGDRVVLDGLELSFLALSISARWVLSLIRLGSAPDTFNTE